jgi:hypothetical protein
MLLGAVLGLFRRDARVGDVVDVLDGPYASRSGKVIALEAGYARVYLDDCCQPVLAPSQYSPVWRGRNFHMTARRFRERDKAGEIARAELANQDRNNSLTM